MKNYLFIKKAASITLLTAVLLLTYGFVDSPSTDAQGARKIVVWSNGLNDIAKAELLARHGALKFKDLSLINGSAVWLPGEASEKALESHPGVLRIDDDVEVHALAKPGTSSVQPPQSIPWGIDRVDAELVWATNNADPVKVVVLDTGISMSHPDLTSNVKGGYNTINPLKSWNDDNGHGSHVAGIIAASNNNIGVVGVAPLADLYAVKVLNRNGSGFLSDIIEGLQWSVQNGAQVINMSLGTNSDIQSFHDAITAAYDANVVLVAAAGNDSEAVDYPAAYPEVIAVSATDSNNVLASFSSRGAEVDLSAPGVSVYSTYKGDGYKTLSGTSMASPHVAGAAALVLNTPTDTQFETITESSASFEVCVSEYDTNCNYAWDNWEVKNKLQGTAVELGSAGYDTWYGWGLVNAWNATQ
ncbi:MAG: S8 family peptidase [Candidatus Liptonbacteria bacterium]|nr:S8 family peptidase [Candidatus Liptonbacteria bacterium]